MAECLAIVILNIITIIVFVKQRQLQRRSTYLIIHLAVVDLLTGVVSGPLQIERIGSNGHLWEYNRPDISYLLILERIFGYLFPVISFLILAFISVERVHATFCPFRHRFMTRRFYRLITAVIWLVPLAVRTAQALMIHFFSLSSNNFNTSIIYLSYFVVLFVVICVCYVLIYLKVRFSRYPQHHGAADLRERKLTSTLFLVTLGSLLTILPTIIFISLLVFHFEFLRSFFRKSSFNFLLVMDLLFFTNSLINPIIYAVRMPKVRASLIQLLFCKS